MRRLTEVVHEPLIEATPSGQLLIPSCRGSRQAARPHDDAAPAACEDELRHAARLPRLELAPGDGQRGREDHRRARAARTPLDADARPRDGRGRVPRGRSGRGVVPRCSAGARCARVAVLTMRSESGRSTPPCGELRQPRDATQSQVHCAAPLGLARGFVAANRTSRTGAEGSVSSRQARGRTLYSYRGAGDLRSGDKVMKFGTAAMGLQRSVQSELSVELGPDVGATRQSCRLPRRPRKPQSRAARAGSPSASGPNGRQTRAMAKTRGIPPM